MADASHRRSLLHQVRTSMLLVPAAYIAAAAVLAVLHVPLEQLTAAEPGIGIASSQLATDLLPSIASATLSLAGFVLTIATLSFQFGASTYSPRLVERLRRDRILQHTIGVALGTFVFSFLVLLVVRPSKSATAASAIIIALIGAVATVLLFVMLLDRLTGTLRPGHTMWTIASRAQQLIPTVYPEREGRETEVEEEAELPDYVRVDWSDLPSHGVIWRDDDFGQLVDVDFDELVGAAAEAGASVHMTVPVGAHLQRREAIAVVRDEDGNLSDELAEQLHDEVCGAFVVARERTVDADPAYALRLLVDIALRALSPGVNDPTTAAQVMDHLGQLVLDCAGRRLGRRDITDVGGRTRVIVPAPGWDALVGLAFTELVDCESSPRVRRHLATVIEMLARRVAKDRRPALQRQLDALAPVVRMPA